MSFWDPSASTSFSLQERWDTGALPQPALCFTQALGTHFTHVLTLVQKALSPWSLLHSPWASLQGQEVDGYSRKFQTHQSLGGLWQVGY